jgi:hypothetical protein
LNKKNRIELKKKSKSNALGLAKHQIIFDSRLLGCMEQLISKISSTYAYVSKYSIEDLQNYVDHRNNEEELNIPNWDEFIELENDICVITRLIDEPYEQFQNLKLYSFEAIFEEKTYNNSWNLSKIQTLICADILKILQSRISENISQLKRQYRLINEFNKNYEPFRNVFAQLQNPDYENEYEQLAEFGFVFNSTSKKNSWDPTIYGLKNYEIEVLIAFEEFLYNLFDVELN